MGPDNALPHNWQRLPRSRLFGSGNLNDEIGHGRSAENIRHGRPDHILARSLGDPFVAFE